MRKILIVLGVIVVVLVAGYFYLRQRGYSLSPKDEISFVNGNLKVDISYCRPSVRERLIFGPEDKEALQPWGKYWRLGANEATEITFNQDVFLVDQPVKKGSYRMYAIPGENYFEIKLNTEIGEWGYSEPNHELDTASAMAPVVPSEFTEQFTIRMDSLYDSGVRIVFKWDSIQWQVPVVTQ